MSAMREKDQADFDLDRFIDMFDEAMTSSDPRVIETLRSLMMIVTLTRPEARNPMQDRERGPLRRLYDDVYHLNNRLHRMEEDINQLLRENKRRWGQSPNWDDKYTLAASVKLAQQIDDDVLNRAIGKINTGGVFPAKGLLKK